MASHCVTKSPVYATAGEVSEMLGVSRAYAYRVIKQLNDELEAKGYLVIAGRVNRKYLEERLYQGGEHNHE